MAFIEIDLGEGFRSGINFNYLVRYDVTPTNNALRFNLMLTFIGGTSNMFELDISELSKFYEKLKEHSFKLQ